jgi:hypothetical protein
MYYEITVFFFYRLLKFEKGVIFYQFGLGLKKLNRWRGKENMRVGQERAGQRLHA